MHGEDASHRVVWLVALALGAGHGTNNYGSIVRSAARKLLQYTGHHLSQAVAGNDALLHIHCGLAAKGRQGRADHEHIVALVGEAVIASNEDVHCPC